jgi:mannosyl-oligosaccharide alpha-1,2-mannosidase
MYLTKTALAVIGLASQVTATPASQRRETSHYPGPNYVSNATRANAVKEAFQTAWDGYYKYAYGHDSLKPVTNSFSDDR